jgi:hypothetical protein
LELEIRWVEGARERERASSSKLVVVVMNVADPHITTKWNMVGEGRGGEGGKKTSLFFNAPHLRFYYLHHPFFILFVNFHICFLMTQINEEPTFPPFYFYFFCARFGKGMTLIN